MSRARIVWLIWHVLMLAGGLSVMRWPRIHDAPFDVRWAAFGITITALVTSFYLAMVSGRDDRQ